MAQYPIEDTRLRVLLWLKGFDPKGTPSGRAVGRHFLNIDVLFAALNFLNQESGAFGKANYLGSPDGESEAGEFLVDSWKEADSLATRLIPSILAVAAHLTNSVDRAQVGVRVVLASETIDLSDDFFSSLEPGRITISTLFQGRLHAPSAGKAEARSTTTYKLREIRSERSVQSDRVLKALQREADHRQTILNSRQDPFEETLSPQPGASSSDPGKDLVTIYAGDQVDAEDIADLFLAISESIEALGGQPLQVRHDGTGNMKTKVPA